MQWSLKLVACAALAMAIAVPSIMAPPVMAQSASPAEVIKERRALMKNTAGNLKGIVGYLKKGEGTPADVARRAEAIAANAAKISTLFPKGTSLADGVGETGAKPAIWEDKAKFDASAGNLRKLALALAATARAGDKKSIGMAMGAFGKEGCGTCHKPFRKSLKK